MRLKVVGIKFGLVTVGHTVTECPHVIRSTVAIPTTITVDVCNTNVC